LDQVLPFQRSSGIITRQSVTQEYPAAQAVVADTRYAAADAPGARTAWQHALNILDQLCHPDADHIRAKLDQPETASLLVSGGVGGAPTMEPPRAIAECTLAGARSSAIDRTRRLSCV